MARRYVSAAWPLTSEADMSHVDAEVGTQVAEVWAVIPGRSEYQVSSEGRVRRVSGGHGAKVGRILKPWVSLGYAYVGLWRDDKQERVPVHRLVALAFLPAPGAGQYQVAHRDGNRLHNRPANLRWATPIENASDRVEHGTDARGAKNPGAKLTEAKVLAIRAASAAGHSQADVARQFGVCRQTVGDIANRRRWSHIA